MTQSMFPHTENIRIHAINHNLLQSHAETSALHDIAENDVFADTISTLKDLLTVILRICFIYAIYCERSRVSTH